MQLWEALSKALPLTVWDMLWMLVWRKIRGKMLLQITIVTPCKLRRMSCLQTWKLSGVRKAVSYKRVKTLQQLGTRGVQNNRLTEKTDKTEEKLTEKTEPKLKTD
jgi:hypothetical protein